MSNGLLFLVSDDFEILKGTKGPILCHGIPGFSLILFYSKQCGYCNDLIPIFKKLPGSITGCQFGMVNVSNNKKVISMSSNTIAPIEYVPYILLYVNGKPFMRYNGPYDGAEIKRFVFEVASKVRDKQKFNNEKVKEDPKGRGIPEYTLGQPLYGKPGEKVCYLNFRTAYDAK